MWQAYLRKCHQSAPKRHSTNCTKESGEDDEVNESLLVSPKTASAPAPVNAHGGHIMMMWTEALSYRLIQTMSTFNHIASLRYSDFLYKVQEAFDLRSHSLRINTITWDGEDLDKEI